MSIPFNKSILYYILKVSRCSGGLESLHKRQVCGSNYNSVSFIDIMQPQVQHIFHFLFVKYIFQRTSFKTIIIIKHFSLNLQTTIFYVAMFWLNPPLYLFGFQSFQWVWFSCSHSHTNCNISQPILYILLVSTLSSNTNLPT